MPFPGELAGVDTVLGASGSEIEVRQHEAPQPKTLKGRSRAILAILLVGLVLAPCAALAWWGGGYFDNASSSTNPVEPAVNEDSAGAVPASGSAAAGGSVGPSGDEQARLLSERYRKRLERLGPKGAYVVVDTVDNKLRLVENGEVVVEAVVSTGSGFRLVDQKGGREWVFDTPFGEHRVERKTRNPIWVKPDWAFIEAGEDPPENAWERVDKVSLGDYALYLGDGYLIHGTLFPSLLGRRITHGCIRVGDADLEKVYRKLPVGARVFLY